MAGNITSTSSILILPPGSTKPFTLFKNLILHSYFLQFDGHIYSRKSSINDTDIEIRKWYGQTLIARVILVNKPQESMSRNMAAAK